jgi:uncharacterized protein (UPF0335 family)
MPTPEDFNMDEFLRATDEEEDFDFPSLDDDEQAETDMGIVDEKQPTEEAAANADATAEEAGEDHSAAAVDEPADDPQPADGAEEGMTEEPAAGADPRGRPGHNSGVDSAALRAFIERIERLEEEKKSCADDIRDVYAEMKGRGYDTKAVRTIIKLRKKDQAEREEEQAILDLYMWSLGMA